MMSGEDRCLACGSDTTNSNPHYPNKEAFCIDCELEIFFDLAIQFQKRNLYPMYFHDKLRSGTETLATRVLRLESK